MNIYEGMTKEELKINMGVKDHRAFIAKLTQLNRKGVCYIDDNDIVHLGFRPVKILSSQELVNMVAQF